MICPFCNTENRDDLDTCYHCNKDLSMLRLLINKAKHHYNNALEHAERGRYYEAIAELHNVLDLDSKNVNALVVLGTVYAKQNLFEKAIEQWEKALNIDNRFQKAHNYIIKAEQVKEVLPLFKWLKIFAGGLIACIITIIVLILLFNKPDKRVLYLREAYNNFKNQNISQAKQNLQQVHTSNSEEHLSLTKDLLENAIKNDIAITKADIQLKMKDGLYYEAIKSLNKMSSKNLDKVNQTWITGMHKQITASIEEQIKNEILNYDQNNGECDAIIENIEKFKALSPQNPLGSDLQKKLMTAITKHFTIDLDNLSQIYQQDKNIAEFEKNFKNLQTKYNKFDQFIPQLTNFSKKIYADEIIRVISEAKSALQKNDLDRAEAILLPAADLKNISKADLDKIVDLSAAVQSRKAEKLITQILEESKNKNYEKIIELADKSSSFSLIDQDKKIVEKERASAIRNLAISRYKYLENMDGKFEEFRQSEEESKKNY